MPKKNHPVRDVKVTRKISTQAYNTWVHYTATHKGDSTDALEKALANLDPKYYKEEMEAYDKEAKRRKEGKIRTSRDYIASDKTVHRA